MLVNVGALYGGRDTKQDFWYQDRMRRDWAHQALRVRGQHSSSRKTLLFRGFLLKVGLGLLLCVLASGYMMLCIMFAIRSLSHSIRYSNYSQNHSFLRSVYEYICLTSIYIYIYQLENLVTPTLDC